MSFQRNDSTSGQPTLGIPYMDTADLLKQFYVNNGCSRPEALKAPALVSISQTLHLSNIPDLTLGIIPKA